jgi:hypothetical protein
MTLTNLTSLHDRRSDRDGVLSNPAVIYRPHPWGHGGHKGERLLDGAWRPVVIEDSMRSYLQGVRVGSKGVYLVEFADTHDVLSSIDALVSPLSTTILEGMMGLAEQQQGTSFNLQRDLVHFEGMFTDPTIMKANGEPELVDALVSLIARVGYRQVEMELRNACGHFVSAFDRSYRERLCDPVENVIIEGRQSAVADKGALS